MQMGSQILPDVLSVGLRAVICGTAAGNRSAALKAYYADSTNSFWSVLLEVGLTPYRLAPSEFTILHQFRLGLTDIAKMVSGTEASLPRDAFDVPAFTKAMRYCRPDIVAFNGKTAG